MDPRRHIRSTFWPLLDFLTTKKNKKNLETTEVAGEESELGLFNESSGLCTVAEIRLPQTAVLVAGGWGGMSDLLQSDGINRQMD